MMGGLTGGLRSTVRLFELPKENRELTERIAQLEAEVDLYHDSLADSINDSQITFSDPAYTYIVAKVVSSSINKRDNFIVLNRGIEDGVYENMAVITPSGEMLGYIAGCSSHYSAALSILSDSFTTSGKIKGGANYGSVSWSGHSRYSVSMNELSKYEIFEVGDTVVSTGFSQIFPGGVTIGTVSSFELNEMHTAYNVEIDLAAEVTSINYVLIVGSRESGEIEALLEDVQGNH